MKISHTGYTFEERLKIREYYGIRPNPANKYGIEWKMSKLEEIAWGAIRNTAHCQNFNPEYPVGKYFVDFADPIARIAIECDSNMYHKGYNPKEGERQHFIEQHGWRVIRFNSRQILANKYQEISERDGSFYDYDYQQQEEIDNNADYCMECFLNSTQFTSQYKRNHGLNGRPYIPEGLEQKEVITTTLHQMRFETRLSKV
ncbi:MAG: DUF559 domain-containing protein [Bacteroidia bacterium]|nr:DUF559 domain-containing protein [Bacteroidia bacterium]